MFVSEALNRTGLHVYLTSGGVLLDKNRDSLKFITFFTFFEKLVKQESISVQCLSSKVVSL